MIQPQQQQASGQGRWQWWMMGIAATLLSGGVAATMHTIHASSERIAVLESQEADTRRKLDRIETKLDQILENGRHRQ
jgi:hypothetical protein